MIPEEFLGPPTHYAVHTHGAVFQSTLAQLLAVASAISDDATRRSIFVWIDFVALNQHRQLNTAADPALVKRVMNACTCGKMAGEQGRQKISGNVWACISMTNIQAAESQNF